MTHVSPGATLVRCYAKCLLRRERGRQLLATRGNLPDEEWSRQESVHSGAAERKMRCAGGNLQERKTRVYGDGGTVAQALRTLPTGSPHLYYGGCLLRGAFRVRGEQVGLSVAAHELEHGARAWVEA